MAAVIVGWLRPLFCGEVKVELTRLGGSRGPPYVTISKPSWRNPAATRAHYGLAASTLVIFPQLGQALGRDYS